MRKDAGAKAGRRRERAREEMASAERSHSAKIRDDGEQDTEVTRCRFCWTEDWASFSFSFTNAKRFTVSLGAAPRTLL
jgi:hypothetical protein